MSVCSRVTCTAALTLAIIGGARRLWSAERLEFAGLSPRTTLETVQKRYPRSQIVSGHVYVSEADSHDHIYGIDLPGLGDVLPSIRIFFERGRRGRNEYPLCRQIEMVITKQHGKPSLVQDFDEEQSRNRRLIWRRGDEELSLLCFRMGRQPRFAAELTIVSRR